MSIDPHSQLPRIIATGRDRYGGSWSESLTGAAIWQCVPCLIMVLHFANMFFSGAKEFHHLVFLVYPLAVFVIPPVAALCHRSLRVGIIALLLPLLAVGILVILVMLCDWGGGFDSYGFHTSSSGMFTAGAFLLMPTVSL